MVQKQEQIAGIVRQRLVLKKCRSINKSVGVTVEGQMNCQNGEAWGPGWWKAVHLDYTLRMK